MNLPVKPEQGEFKDVIDPADLAFEAEHKKTSLISNNKQGKQFGTKNIYTKDTYKVANFDKKEELKKEGDNKDVPVWSKSDSGDDYDVN